MGILLFGFKSVFHIYWTNQYHFRGPRIKYWHNEWSTILKGTIDSDDRGSALQRLCRNYQYLVQNYRQSHYYHTFRPMRIRSILSPLCVSSYRRRSQELSHAFKDRPMTPEESVLYWTKYVIKWSDTLEIVGSGYAVLSIFHVGYHRDDSFHSVLCNFRDLFVKSHRKYPFLKMTLLKLSHKIQNIVITSLYSHDFRNSIRQE